MISYSDTIYKMQYNQCHISLLLENAVTTANNIKKVIMLQKKKCSQCILQFWSSQ